MASLSGAPASVNRTPLDIRSLPWCSRLAADYAWNFSAVADFYAGDPSSREAWRDRVAAVQATTRDRAEVARVLVSQLTGRGAPPPARAAAESLADARTVAVVTGQQAGLFGGPLFTLLKALTAIRLAARVREEQGVPAVAVFWVDAEDHDWDEIRSCGLLDGDARFTTVAVAAPDGAGVRPVARLPLDESVNAALDAMAATLPVTDATADLLAGLRSAYVPGRTMPQAFAHWLDALLGPAGLVVYDAADPAAKPLAANLFAEELSHPGRTGTLAAQAASALTAAGYKAQVVPVDGSAALFHLDEGRTPIRLDGDVFVAGSLRESPAALAGQARRAPERFSPNVLLRPLVQDSIFPTVCYVAGPSELAYLGQLKGVYAAFGLPMPLIQPRASATLLDSNAVRFLSRYEVPLPSLRAQDEALLNALLATQMPPGIEVAVSDAATALTLRMEALASAAADVDATLDGATRSALGRMQDDLKKLHGKILQAAKRKDDTLRRQFTRAQAQAFPNGQPQERAVGFVTFLNRVGPTLVDRLRDELPVADAGHHWLLTL